MITPTIGHEREHGVDLHVRPCASFDHPASLAPGANTNVANVDGPGGNVSRLLPVRHCQEKLLAVVEKQSVGGCDEGFNLVLVFIL